MVPPFASIRFLPHQSVPISLTHRIPPNIAIMRCRTLRVHDERKKKKHKTIKKSTSVNQALICDIYVAYRRMK